MCARGRPEEKEKEGHRFSHSPSFLSFLISLEAAWPAELASQRQTYEDWNRDLKINPQLLQEMEEEEQILDVSDHVRLPSVLSSPRF